MAKKLPAAKSERAVSRRPKTEPGPVLELTDATRKFTRYRDPLTGQYKRPNPRRKRPLREEIWVTTPQGAPKLITRAGLVKLKKPRTYAERVASQPTARRLKSRRVAATIAENWNLDADVVEARLDYAGRFRKNVKDWFERHPEKLPPVRTRQPKNRPKPKGKPKPKSKRKGARRG